MGVSQSDWKCLSPIIVVEDDWMRLVPNQLYWLDMLVPNACLVSVHDWMCVPPIMMIINICVCPCS